MEDGVRCGGLHTGLRGPTPQLSKERMFLLRCSWKVCLFLPRLDGACFGLFLREWRQAFPAEPWAVILDNSGAHTSGRVRWPDDVAPVHLPACSPELNPGERWFKEWREPLANHAHDSLETLEAALIQALRPYWEHPLALVQLTAYPWWRQGVQYITTLAE
jgi:hypothetical protein